MARDLTLDELPSVAGHALVDERSHPDHEGGGLVECECGDEFGGPDGRSARASWVAHLPKGVG